MTASVEKNLVSDSTPGEHNPAGRDKLLAYLANKGIRVSSPPKQMFSTRRPELTPIDNQENSHPK